MANNCAKNERNPKSSSKVIAWTRICGRRRQRTNRYKNIKSPPVYRGDLISPSCYQEHLMNFEDWVPFYVSQLFWWHPSRKCPTCNHPKLCSEYNLTSTCTPASQDNSDISWLSKLSNIDQNWEHLSSFNTCSEDLLLSSIAVMTCKCKKTCW